VAAVSRFWRFWALLLELARVVLLVALLVARWLIRLKETPITKHTGHHGWRLKDEPPIP
jgi:hypothetical protein